VRNGCVTAFLPTLRRKGRVKKSVQMSALKYFVKFRAYVIRGEKEKKTTLVFCFGPKYRMYRNPDFM